MLRADGHSWPSEGSAPLRDVWWARVDQPLDHQAQSEFEPLSSPDPAISSGIIEKTFG
jgi:hypothetical protein